MKKAIFTFLVLLCIGTWAYGQFSSEEWHKGYLVTTSQDTVTGLINYDMEANIVQVSANDNVRAYSSFKVFYFEIFDKIQQNYRQFYTLPYALKTDYETPIIFEVLYEGSTSLLAREKIIQEVATSSQVWSSVRVVQPKIDYEYFFLSREGTMRYYNGQKAHLLIILGDKKIQVKRYIKDNRLKTNLMRDLIRITSFYNSI